eukprot:2699172-Amphidinium_carterae.2
MESKTKRKNSQVVKRLLESSPLPLEPAVVARVLQKSLLNLPDGPVSTSIGKDIARLRATYCESVFLFHQEEGETVCLKLILAKCTPTTLVWLKLVPLHVSALEICDRDRVWRGEEMVPPTCCWTYDLTELAVVDPFLAADISEVDVFMTSQFEGNAVLVTHDFCSGFAENHAALVRTLPARRTHSGKAAHTRKHSKRETGESSSESSALECEATTVPATDPDVESTAGADSQESGSDGDIIEQEWSQACVALEHEREAIRIQESEPHEWFRFDLMGGSWNIARSGKVAYGPRVSAKPNTVASAFLKAFGIANSASFEHGTYGEGVSHQLAALWREVVTRRAVFWHCAGCPSEWPAAQYKEEPFPPDLQMDPDVLNARARARRDKILGTAFRR